MNIAAIISVRDEVELIDANIDYHLSIGFKGIVVADILSSDGTEEKLDSYGNNPKVRVVKAPSQDYEVFDWRQVLVDIAKETYQPNFISHIDPDEFLYSPKIENLDSAVFTQDQLTITRLNCVSGMKVGFVAPECMRDIDDLDVVRHPMPNIFSQIDNRDPAAWLFTQVAPKVICKADRIARFVGGSHSAVDKFGQELEDVASDLLVFIHFPFTSYKRFLRKVRNIDNLVDMPSERTNAEYAYHWKRWARLYREGGGEAILEEYQRQFAGTMSNRYAGCVDKARNCLG